MPRRDRAARRRDRGTDGGRDRGAPDRRWLANPSHLGAVVLFLSVVALYWPATGFQFVNLDDGLYVTANRHVQAGLTADGLRWAFSNDDAALWHPLTWLSHMLDCQLYGLAPGGHHLTSVLLHATNTALVFVVLLRMTGLAWRSLAVAALFGLHPLRVESVAWVADRKDVLSGLCFLLTLWAYAFYAARPRLGRFCLVVLGFAAGLLSKAMLVTTPFVLLLLDYWPLRRTESTPARTLVAEKAALFAMSAGAAAAELMVGRAAILSMEAVPPTARLANAMVAHGTYLEKTVWPVRLAVLYPLMATQPARDVIAGAVLLAALSAGAVLCRRRLPHLSVGWFWFVGTLVPVSGLVQNGVQSMADRYTYIPSIGLLMAFVWASTDLLTRWRAPAAAMAAATILVLGGLAATSHVQLMYWKDSVTLFTHVLEVVPFSWPARNNLGLALNAQGKVEDAIAQYRAALSIRPDSLYALTNLGAALTKQGRLDDAMVSLRAALAVKPDDPQVLDNVGEVLLRQGKPDEAAPYFSAALHAQPDYAVAAQNLGIALASQQRMDDAVESFRAALRLDPRYADAHYNLGAALAAQGKLDEAMDEFAAALETDPGYAKAHAARGNVLLRRGMVDQAATELTEALRTDPGLADAHFHLAAILARQGRQREADEHYATAVRLQPSLARGAATQTN